MEISKIVIVPKWSKYEYDLHRYGLTHEQLIAKYTAQGVDVKRVLDSHERQKKSLEELKRFFGQHQFVPRGEYSREIAAGADLVISLGGDNHLQYVSHFIDKGLVMGVNADILSSEGALDYFTAEKFEQVFKQLERGDFDIEEWTRLEAKVNGNPVQMATCDYLVAEDRRKDMSRHILEFRGRSEEQKGSGLLVATGAGSTGWYNSVYRSMHGTDGIFPRTETSARFLLTEPYIGRLCGYSMTDGTVEPGEDLIVHSLNDSRGLVSSDSLEDYEFDMGARVVINVSNNRLRVIKVKE